MAALGRGHRAYATSPVFLRVRFVGMKRTLRLRREALTDLTTTDLEGIRGGAITVGDHCGPLFDTTVVDKLSLTSCRFTEATCTW